MNLQEKVFNALDAALNVPVVVKYENEYNGDYPVVVFEEVGNVPAFFCDNGALLRTITYKISIGTQDDRYERIETCVEFTMRQLGFRRVDANEETSNNVFWRELKFSIFTEVDKNV